MRSPPVLHPDRTMCLNKRHASQSAILFHRGAPAHPFILAPSVTLDQVRGYSAESEEEMRFRDASCNATTDLFCLRPTTSPLPCWPSRRTEHPKHKSTLLVISRPVSMAAEQQTAAAISHHHDDGRANIQTPQVPLETKVRRGQIEIVNGSPSPFCGLYIRGCNNTLATGGMASSSPSFLDTGREKGRRVSRT